MTYYCTYCESELDPDEALRRDPGTYNNLTQRGYNGEPPSYDLVNCCPRCGSVNCVEERE